MKKNASVLKAFGLLGPEEILKLSEESSSRQMRKVAGDHFVSWDESEEVTVAKVLAFPEQKTSRPQDLPAPLEVPEKETEASSTPPSHIVTADILLLQREISKEAEETLSRVKARAGYRKTNDGLMMKTKSLDDGKQKLRFVSTNGILVDKKQA